MVVNLTCVNIVLHTQAKVLQILFKYCISKLLNSIKGCNLVVMALLVSINIPDLKFLFEKTL